MTEGKAARIGHEEYKRSLHKDSGLIWKYDAIKAIAEYISDGDVDRYIAVAKDMLKDIPSVEPTVDKDYLVSLIQEAVYDGEACKRMLDLVEPRQGEWITIDTKVISVPIKWNKDDDRKPSYLHKMRCSECGFIKSFVDGHNAQYRFCPSCGERLRGEGNARWYAENCTSTG